MLRIVIFVSIWFLSVSNAPAQVMIDPDKLGRSAEPYAMTENEIWLVQNVLYSLTYEIGPPDGKAGPQTRAALTSYLTNSGRTDGVLTKADVDRLAAIDTTTFRFAAVAYTANGVYETAWDQESRQRASAMVKSACEQKAAAPSDCKVVIGVATDAKDWSWIVTLKCENATTYSVRAIAHTQKSVAQQWTYQNASERGFAANECKVLGTIEARGRHK